jgi:hypothetical protein
VPVEGLAPETQGAAGAAPEPAEVASGEAPVMAGKERDDVLPVKSGSSRPLTGNSRCGADPFGTDVWGRHE